MNVFRVIIFLFLSLLTTLISYGQDYVQVDHEQNQLYHDILQDFEKNYSNGNISNLYNLAPLLDVEVKISDNLGYHFFESKVREVVVRKIKESSLFINVNLDSITKSKDVFRIFLDTNRITYSNLIGAFISTPIENTSVSYSLRDKKISQKNKLIFFSDKELQKFDVDKAKYDNEVDYYGAILKKADRYSGDEFFTKISNHLIQTKDPKALLYIGTEPYRHRYKYNKSSRSEIFYHIICSYINVVIEVENDKGVLTHLLSDDDFNNVKSENFFKYWSLHYDDYVWDNSNQIFINTKEEGKPYNNLELHFDNLYNSDDSVAMSSFKSIIESPIDKVNKLLEIHELDGYGNSAPNRILPSFLKKRIKALTKLTSYYKNHEITYDLTEKTQNYIRELKSTKNYKDLIDAENRITKELNTIDVISLEYNLSLKNHNYSRGSLNDSFSRIFDIYYSIHFEEILNNEKQLRHYLKRSQLYGQFGIVGIQNYYLNKFGQIDGKLKSILKDVLLTEEDEDIKNACMRLLQLTKTENGVENRIDYLFKNLIDSNGEINPKIKSNLDFYLSRDYRKHKYFAFEYKRNYVPKYLLNLTDTDLLELNQAYHEGSKISNEYLYSYFKEKLITKDSLTELDFNRVSGYKNFEPLDANIIIKHIYKLKSDRRIGYVNFGGNIKTKDFEKIFHKSNITHDVIDLLDQSKEVNSNMIIQNILSFSKKAKDKGSYYKSIIDYTNFLDWLDKPNVELDVDDEIIKELNHNLKNAKEDEYDYRAYYTNLFLFENRNKTISDKIELIRKIKEEKIKKELLQLVFIKSPKDNIDGVIEGIINHYELFSEREIRKYITLNIGIPLADYSKETLKQLLTFSITHNRKELFKKYSLIYYPNLYSEKELDFGEIYKYLSFDVVLGFIGGQGDDRYDSILPLLRLLEENFNTTLNFDNNLKYVDVSTTTSIKRRCNAWKKFLKEEGLVTKELKYPSFQ